MKKVMAVVLGVFAIGGVCVLVHQSAVSGYKAGCRDVMVNLLSDAGVNPQQIDQDSLNKYCEDLANRYVGRK